MYKVLLVDDEPWALRGIRKAFPWEDMGFAVIAETTRSTDALETILAGNPDAIFTDIRMPRLTGIELMQQARARGCGSEFIVVSGFSEFSYAQEAIRLGAFDYCLKPVDLGYAAKLLARLKEHLDARKMRDDGMLWDALMEGRGDLGEALRRRGFAGGSGCFQVASIVYGEQARPEAVSLCLGDTRHIALKAGQNKLVVVFDAAGDGKSRLVAGNPHGTYMGLSTSADSADEITRLVPEADTAAADFFIYGRHRVYEFAKKNIAAVNACVEKILPLIGKSGTEELGGAIDGIPAYFISQGLHIGDLAYLWNQLAAYIARKHPEAAAGTALEFTDYNHIVEQFHDFESLCDHLCNELAIAGDSAKPVKEETAGQNREFGKLLKYMQGHYDGQLYQRDLAKEFFINQKYLSYLFKRHTGSTFSDYLNRIRIDKSRELLEDYDLTIDEVAQRSGYNDYFYFIKVFKKYNGKTPSQYRKENEGLRGGGTQ